MSRGVVILLWVIGIIVVGVVVSLVIWTNGMKKTLQLQIRDVDLTSVPDGTYRGSYAGGRFSCTVDVQVADHRISGVKIIKDQFCNPYSPAVQQLFDKTVANQSLSVKADGIFGGTATINGYLAAIENALKGAGTH